MEKALQKLARTLDAFDEASLMALWDKYQAIAQDFQPSKRWEEAVLVLGLIQMVRWKNQLFNHHWAVQQGVHTTPPEVSPPLQEILGPGSGDSIEERGKVLRFRPRKGDDPV